MASSRRPAAARQSPGPVGQAGAQGAPPPQRSTTSGAARRRRDREQGLLPPPRPAAGRPSIYEPHELDRFSAAVQQYLDDCAARQRWPRKTGLAVALNVSMDTLDRYEAARPEFAEVLKLAYARMEDAVLMLTAQGTIPVALGLFTAKAYFGRNELGPQFNLNILLNNVNERDLSDEQIERLLASEPPRVVLGSTGRLLPG